MDIAERTRHAASRTAHRRETATRPTVDNNARHEPPLRADTPQQAPTQSSGAPLSRDAPPHHRQQHECYRTTLPIPLRSENASSVEEPASRIVARDSSNPHEPPDFTSAYHQSAESARSTRAHTPPPHPNPNTTRHTRAPLQPPHPHPSHHSRQ